MVQRKDAQWTVTHTFLSMHSSLDSILFLSAELYCISFLLPLPNPWGQGLGLLHWGTWNGIVRPLCKRVTGLQRKDVFQLMPAPFLRSCYLFYRQSFQARGGLDWVVLGYKGGPWFYLCIIIFNNNKFIIYLLYYCFYFWPRWVFAAACGLSPVMVSGDCSSLRCAGFSLRCFLLFQSTGSRACGLQQVWYVGTGVVVPGLICPLACGIFLGRGSNLCPLHWQANSQPLDHQGRPGFFSLSFFVHIVCIWETLNGWMIWCATGNNPCPCC